MKLRYGVNCAESFQVLDYNEKLIIDEVEITLYPAGHILGSAQVLVEYKGEKINFTGDFKTTYDTTCENFEKQLCNLSPESTFLTRARSQMVSHQISYVLGYEVVGSKWTRIRSKKRKSKEL